MTLSALLRWMAPYAFLSMVWACGDKTVPYQPPPADTKPSSNAPGGAVPPSNTPNLKTSELGEIQIVQGAQQSSLGTLPSECKLIKQQTNILTPTYSSLLAIAQCPANKLWQTLWVVESQQGFNIWQRFRIVQHEPNEYIELGARFNDRDHTFELIVSPYSTPEVNAQAGLSIPWHVHGSSLTQIATEPEQSMQRWVETARQGMKSQPELSIKQLDAVLRAHSVLCREVAGPKLSIQDSSQGLACGASKAAGMAGALRFQQYSETSALESAVALYQKLSSPGYELTPDARTLLKAGWNTLGSSTEFKVHQGPELLESIPARTTASLLEFLDEQTILIHTKTPLRFSVGATAFEPTAVTPTSNYILDPKGQMAVVDIHRECNGYALGLMPRASITDGLLIPKPTRSVTFTETEGTNNCQLNSKIQKDTGGWQVLKWTEQGVLVVRADETRIVPIDSQGTLTSPPTVVKTTSSAAMAHGVPAEPPSISGYVHGVPGGVFVRLAKKNDPKAFLMRPKHWADQDLVPEYAVLSSSGNRVAMIVQHHLVVLERVGPSP